MTFDIRKITSEVSERERVFSTKYRQTFKLKFSILSLWRKNRKESNVHRSLVYFRVKSCQKKSLQNLFKKILKQK